MKRIVEGHLRFQKTVYPGKKDIFQRLAKGQSPQALWITCADSRVEPTLITQTDPGDLFLCRAVGNIVPTFGHESEGVSSTIEYAVAVLKVPNIIICGHSDCGAMRGLLNRSGIDKLPATSRWLRHAEAARLYVEETCAEMNDQDRLTAMIEENVLAQMENIRTHPEVFKRMKTGQLQVHGWVYNIGAGELSAFDAKVRKFRPIGEVYRDEAPPATIPAVPSVDRVVAVAS